MTEQTRLVPMPQDRLGSWLDTTMDEYVESRVLAGDTRERAEQNRRESLEKWFPDGSPATGHLVWDVVDAEDTVVGYLWIGPFAPDSPEWWVFNVEIDEPHRRRGHARRALELAQDAARAAGAASIGLNVFGYNTGARALYEELGYETTAVQMRLPLD